MFGLTCTTARFFIPKAQRFERGFYFHFQVENYEEILCVYELNVLIIQYFKYLLRTAGVDMFLQNKDSLCLKKDCP